MNELEFMVALYGSQYKSDSLRCRTGLYVYRHKDCNLLEMAGEFVWTSEYGPGKGERCTVEHILPEIQRMKRRLKRYNMPYKIIEYGEHMIRLVQL